MITVRLRAIVLATLLILTFSQGTSASILAIASLTNSQAGPTPPVTPTTSTGDPRPASFATGVFEVNDEMTAMTFTLMAFNIDLTGMQTADSNDDLVSAAIRIGLPFTTGGVAFGFFGEPFDDTDPNDMTVTPFSNAVGGVISGKWDALEGHGTSLTEQLAGDNLEHFRLFVEFRTIQFPRGEIRGVIQEVVPAPEPASLPIFGLASALMVSRTRRWNWPRR